MAIKLSRLEINQRAKLVEELSQLYSTLEDGINTYNEALAAARQELQPLLDEYNAKVQEAKEWADLIGSDKRGEWDEKSERWQEGEAGCNADTWLMEWEDVTLDPVEIELPGDLDLLGFTEASEQLSDLPEEP